MKFVKMQGCGNDYIYIDGSKEKAENKPELVRRLSDRHFGIGGDGVIFINPSKIADFEMEMYNADGSRGEMCGNGIRCVAKFVYDYGLTTKNPVTIESFGKVRILDLKTENSKVVSVTVDMGEPILTAEEIPADPKHTVSGASADGRLIDAAYLVDKKEVRMTAVSMGNPHAVVYVKDTDSLDLEKIGPAYEHHPVFPNAVNTEFIQVLDRSHVKMRVWERGSGETLACGTGACASVVASVLNGRTDRLVTVHLLGGDLTIEWREADGHVYMTGPACTVFEGEIEV